MTLMDTREAGPSSRKTSQSTYTRLENWRKRSSRSSSSKSHEKKKKENEGPG